MKRFAVLLVMLFGCLPLLQGQPAPLVAKIEGETRYKVYSLVRLKAVGVDAKAALLWRIYPPKDVQRATTQKGVLEFVAPPGTYSVELLVISQTGEGLTVEEVKTTVVIESLSPPPPVRPPTAPSTEQAIGRLRMGNKGCTATVIGPRRPDGCWDVLTAAHCIGAVGERGSLDIKDGRTLGVVVLTRDVEADLCWLITENPVESLPFAELSPDLPPTGTAIWHAGYGQDKPGNREVGTVLGKRTGTDQLVMRLSVSSGDSGGGIFRADTNRLVSVVCCTTRIGSSATMFGGSSVRASQIRPQGPNVTEYP